MKDLIKTIIWVILGLFLLSLISNIITNISLYYAANSEIIDLAFIIIAAIVFIAASIFGLHIYPKKLKRDFLAKKNNIKLLTDTIKSLSSGHPGYNLDGFTEHSNYSTIKNSLSEKLIQCVANKNIKQHLQALRRKKTQLTYTDDYGRKLDEKWKKELNYFISEIMFPLNIETISDPVFALISDEFSYYSEIKEPSVNNYWVQWLERTIPESQPSIAFKDSMTGHEYEHYVAEIIRSAGWIANVTKGSGDHGADIIAEHNDARLVVQCKQYTSTVGNKSVQEAYSAQGFYECHHACVVTNSSFTPAAKQAAKKLGVELLHHDSLPDYLTT